LREGLGAEPDDRAVQDTERARINSGPEVLQRRPGGKISGAVAGEDLNKAGRPAAVRDKDGGEMWAYCAYEGC
jgi:hypothetical protein